MRAGHERAIQEGRRPMSLGIERERPGSVHAAQAAASRRRAIAAYGPRTTPDRTSVIRVSRDNAVPELPEVEAVRRELAPAMRGARFRRVIVRRAGLRTLFPDRFAARLRGRTVRGLVRRGKYLLADLSSGETLLMHLGMSGSFQVDHPAPDASRSVRRRTSAMRTTTSSFRCRPARRSPSTIRDASA